MEIKPAVLDDGNEVILANLPGDKHIECNKNKKAEGLMTQLTKSQWNSEWTNSTQCRVMK